MHVQTLPKLTHDAVLICPIDAKDIADWQAYLHLPSVLEHTSWNNPSVEELRGYLGNETSSDPASLLRKAIALKDGNDFIGSIGLHSIANAVGNALVAWAHHMSSWYGCKPLFSTPISARGTA